MSGYPSVLARLTVETMALREQVDAALFGPLALPTVAGYRRLLCQLYGFHAPLEIALTATAGVDAGFLHGRLKAPLLATDLLALGLGPGDYPVLARRHEVPTFRATADAFGWLYATERLTLRLPGLCSRLAERLPVVLAVGSAYITCYDDRTDEHWRELGAMLDEVAWSRANADRLVAAARAGLQSLLACVQPRTQHHQVAPEPRSQAAS